MKISIGSSHDYPAARRVSDRNLLFPATTAGPNPQNMEMDDFADYCHHVSAVIPETRLFPGLLSGSIRFYNYFVMRRCNAHVLTARKPQFCQPVTAQLNFRKTAVRLQAAFYLLLHAEPTAGRRRFFCFDSFIVFRRLAFRFLPGHGVLRYYRLRSGLQQINAIQGTHITSHFHHTQIYNPLIPLSKCFSPLHPVEIIRRQRVFNGSDKEKGRATARPFSL